MAYRTEIYNDLDDETVVIEFTPEQQRSYLQWINTGACKQTTTLRREIKDMESTLRYMDEQIAAASGWARVSLLMRRADVAHKVAWCRNRLQWLRAEFGIR